ncbi:M48 family metallopeptidase [Enterovibrio calviensis]|uniref:M48 family metallopeptidase n=1 Tax=Enterovibrio calviensis TaxID=91359 RepID=UPI0004862CDD|nr:M48 family metallopeptidase [Enterovibrio calviensis]
MVNGVAFSAGESAKHEATFTVVAQNRAVLNYDGQTVTCDLASVTPSESIGTLPLQLCFPNGELFIPDDESSLPLCFQRSKKGGLSRLESSKAAIFSFVVGAVFLITLFFYVGVPALSTGIAKALPDDVPMAVGDHVMTQLDGQLLTQSALDAPRQDAIRKRFEMLLASLPPMPITPKLEFRRWEQGPNAFALSDGTIVLLDSLVLLAENDAQLESVILHELGHVYHQHVMIRLVRSTLISVSVAVITGESTGVIDLMTGVGVLLATAGYSRADEVQSDAFAAQYLTAIYGNATAQAEMFTLMGQGLTDGEVTQWLSSHPDTKSRIQATENFQEQ